MSDEENDPYAEIDLRAAHFDDHHRFPRHRDRDQNEGKTDANRIGFASVFIFVDFSSIQNRYR